MKNIAVYFFLFVLVFSGRGQNFPTIHGMTVVPQVPTPNDQVMVIARVTTPSSGSKVGSSVNVSTTPKMIDLRVCYFTGMLPATKTYTDTFYVGKIAPGTYSLQLTATLSSSVSVCEPLDSNKLSQSLQVSQLSGLSVRGASVKWKVFPTMSATEIIIETDVLVPTSSATNGSNQSSANPDQHFMNRTAQIVSVGGQVMKEIPLKRKNRIDISTLPPGLYFIYAGSEPGFPPKKFIRTYGD